MFPSKYFANLHMFDKPKIYVWINANSLEYAINAYQILNEQQFETPCASSRPHRERVNVHKTDTHP